MHIFWWVSWVKYSCWKIDYGPNALIIHFGVYTYQGICETQDINPDEPILSIICEENNEINNGLIKRPAYGKKNHTPKIPYVIDPFQKGHY